MVLISSAVALMLHWLSCTKYTMGNCFNTANCNASLTSPSLIQPSPNEHTTTGDLPSSDFLNRPGKFFSKCCTPCANPVVGMACMPVALIRSVMEGFGSLFVLSFQK